ncbi:MAG: glycine cleavage system aminomethyltransferase GcvT [Verrucomicrobiaceae bacterium]|nr:glycine cleavage system aminomethyltransferase GcvT [Verrucomicrobiaceae bacterium]
MPTAPLLHSPLHDEHLRHDGRLVDFAGWKMPVQYTGILEEHRAVRSGCGAFDISHMGQVFLSGENAAGWLNGILTGNIPEMGEKTSLYTFMLNENGGIIDDLIAYRLGPDSFLLVVNASMVDEDVTWLQGHLEDGVILEDRSRQFAAIAIQGPKAEDLAREMLGETGCTMPARNTLAYFTGASGTTYLCGTGYTGEPGFEMICPLQDGPQWFNKALQTGAVPCGLGARDSLRLEMGFPLNGSDLSPARSPLTAGLGFFVDLEKGPFIGKEVLLKEKQDGIREKLTGIEMTVKGPPPRPGYALFANNEAAGNLCSAGLSPSLGNGIGLAYLPVALSRIDTALEIDIRGKRFAARVAKKPFYRPPR